MDLLQQIEKIIGFQVNEEGLDESIVDFENGVSNKITEYKYECDNRDQTNDDPSVLLLSNEDLSLRYEENEFGKGSTIRPILFIFCYAAEGFSKENAKTVSDGIETIIKKDKLIDSGANPIIKLFFISSNLETAISSEEFLTKKHNVRDIVLKYVKSEISKYSKRDITATYDYLESEERVKNSPVRVLSRTRVTQSKVLGNPNTVGHVFSANLFDLVRLYNQKGKTLFNKNIRYGIADELDVDSVIKDTLAKKPEEFWYLNNGITLILEKNNLNLQNHERISLSDPEDKSNEIKITVINGAQTLNSAAKFFYTQKHRNDSKDKAFVMLKVIEITTSEDEKEDVNNRIDNITISLNRQKPIIADDIAFTLPIVEHINNLRKTVEGESQKDQEFKQDNLSVNNKLLQESVEPDEIQEVLPLGVEETQDATSQKQEENLSPYVFSIVRRGDVSSIRNRRYTLKVLPRILCTIFLEKPGTARTGSNKSLIEIDPVNNHFSFHDGELFPTIQNEEQHFKNIFKEHYKPVNFAMAIYDEVDKFSKDKECIKSIEKSHSRAKHINKYGKYFIIYSVIKSLKGNHKTFEQWEFTASEGRSFLSKEKYKKIVEELTKSWESTIAEAELENGSKREASPWDSNAFKKDQNILDTYENCKEEIKNILNAEKISEEQLEPEPLF
ncbi:AIPR protein [Priestia aryabhattai B8W22]|uniref:AIPR family protein n=1 Tax=Priestia aryabhattai TaxID=412384 RepID=UPI000887E37A|nr:AIPR protein [Priestia aryabhattai B8W22]